MERDEGEAASVIVMTEREGELARAEAADAALAVRARAGGPGAEAAFRGLYERYADEVHAYCAHLTGDPALAEDVFQDAFVRVYTHLDRYDPGRPFRPWLYRIARNTAVDALRVRGKHHRLARASADRCAGPAGVVGEVARRESITRARAALDRLPDETRELLVGRHGLGLKLAELADSFDCTERTVRNRLRSAAARLAAELRRPGGDA